MTFDAIFISDHSKPSINSASICRMPFCFLFHRIKAFYKFMSPLSSAMAHPPVCFLSMERLEGLILLSKRKSVCMWGDPSCHTPATVTNSFVFSPATPVPQLHMKSPCHHSPVFQSAFQGKQLSQPLSSWSKHHLNYRHGPGTPAPPSSFRNQTPSPRSCECEVYFRLGTTPPAAGLAGR